MPCGVLLDLGAPRGITPIGMEALDVLRIQKGFLEVGADTDGDTSALDVGWGAAIEKKPGDFIGRRSLKRPAMQSAARLQLVACCPRIPNCGFRSEPMPLMPPATSTATSPRAA